MMSPYLIHTLLYLSWLLNEEGGGEEGDHRIGRGFFTPQALKMRWHVSYTQTPACGSGHGRGAGGRGSTHKSTSKRCKWLEMQILTSLQAFFAKPEIWLDRL